jgi:2-desacetyl-2-hydroxyethyl bacteriochlorophyllide A dehydrogenase
MTVGNMVLTDAPIPQPGPDDVLVRVAACGICGSDRHFFKGEFPTSPPVTLGHEFSGFVEAVGANVVQLKPGALVTCDPNIACGRCEQCRRGRPNLCENLQAIGVTRDGGFADYVVMPQNQAVELPGNLPPLHGAFSEPLACCLHAIDIACIPTGASVAILGGGVIGLIMVQLARLAGATTIILSTRQKPRRDLALELGATHAVDAARTDADNFIAGPTGIVPGGVDVVIECAGVPETFAQSVNIARRGAAVVVFGVTPKGATIPIEPFAVLTKELRLESAWLNPFTHGRAAKLIAEGALELDKLVTRTIPLADVPAVIGSAPAFGEIKIVAVPGS